MPRCSRGPKSQGLLDLAIMPSMPGVSHVAPSRDGPQRKTRQCCTALARIRPALGRGVRPAL
eukprot:14458158-Alexandrium_andersonii.AAC.1